MSYILNFDIDKSLTGDLFMARKATDWTGKKFYHLTFLCRTESPYKNCTTAFWEVECNCGKKIVAMGFHIRKGITQSCGCIKSQCLYASWRNMKNRCYCDNHKESHRYKDRGIVVCAEWHEWKNFELWALQHGWEPGLSLDRIDNDGNYCPENCQWLTRSENSKKLQIDNPTPLERFKEMSIKSNEARKLKKQQRESITI